MQNLKFEVKVHTQHISLNTPAPQSNMGAAASLSGDYFLQQGQIVRVDGWDEILDNFWRK